MRLLTALLLSLLISTLTPASQAMTAELPHDEVQRLVTSGSIRSLDYSLTLLAQYCQGELIDASLYQEDDKWRYDLQLKIKKGHIIHLFLDATNGMPESIDQLPSECQINETATR
ncbi:MULTISPECIES: hypothetical protein [unclassified Shewanella]|uniref:PepSY domain-containing protein n=1 Tax=unclassified Shewanella TaxID=196818 RepID=UPI000970A20E|nr:MULTISPECIES: hypothetical protein [unclassified Shewanella]MDO6618045.1 hypothetical protein [Shewanella sp. 6_MG-2023]MDO6640970.1 hypothetical protein [Shewanella sp. 5_MG-2023]MDO6679204.1 hypothetical protein [Shewanella sp. 4_MG-2023]MDO6776505.1 hypothetical protein [Shewanella sp. 3_MG-2023]PMG30705.1 hypothetical protein BCU94_02080 [Shewanella sp. 10N.286.52.C2]